MRRFAGVLTVAVALAGVATGCGKNSRERTAGAGGGGSGDGGGVPPAAEKSGLRLPAARTRSQNDLRMIGLAMHTFHDANNAFPSGVYGPSGEELGLSWRVAILPYLEEAALYQQFKLDEPWDSEHNVKLIADMPDVFAPPGDRTPKGYTYLRAFAGADGFIPPVGRGRPGATALGRKMYGVTDGLSNTILVAEAADPVIWTKPDELGYEAAGPAPKLGGVYPDGFHVLFADGSTRRLPKSTPEKTMRALITPAGAEVIDLP